jgi:thiol-disulfide isomerase/thioredoxin
VSRALLLRAPALRAPALRAGRRTVVLAAAVSAGVLLIVGLAAGWASGGHSNVTYVDGSDSAVLYAAGHRPLAPDFSGTTLTGSRLSFSSYRGNVVVLNFWGSWCVPCREEASTLASVAALYRSSGVAFLGVDVRDTTASALAFTRSFGISYPSVTDPSSAITLDFTSVVPIAGTPTTLVIDRTGHIAGAVFGSATYPELTAILAKVTGKAAAEAVSR